MLASNSYTKFVVSDVIYFLFTLPIQHNLINSNFHCFSLFPKKCNSDIKCFNGWFKNILHTNITVNILFCMYFKNTLHGIEILHSLQF